jgi:hypothetical protein
MNKYRVPLMCFILCLWLVTICHGQERSVNNKAAEPSPAASSDPKKESPKPAMGLIDTLTAQKDKYQKQLQDSINNKISSVDNKLKELNNISKPGEAASKSKPSEVVKGPGAPKEPSQSGESGKAAEPNLWGKIVSFLETVTGYWKKLSSLISFLFK